MSLVDYRNLRTLRQLAEECPAIPYNTIRKLVEQREHNGLAAAIVPLGRRLLVDLVLFNKWLSRGGATAGTSPPSGRQHPRSAAR